MTFGSEQDRNLHTLVIVREPLTMFPGGMKQMRRARPSSTPNRASIFVPLVARHAPSRDQRVAIGACTHNVSRLYGLYESSAL